MDQSDCCFWNRRAQISNFNHNIWCRVHIDDEEKMSMSYAYWQVIRLNAINGKHPTPALRVSVSLGFQNLKWLTRFVHQQHLCRVHCVTNDWLLTTLYDYPPLVASYGYSMATILYIINSIFNFSPDSGPNLLNRSLALHDGILGGWALPALSERAMKRRKEWT